MSSRGSAKAVKRTTKRSSSSDEKVKETKSAASKGTKSTASKATKQVSKAEVKATKDTTETVSKTETTETETETDSGYRPPLMEHLEVLEKNRREVHETLRNMLKTLKECHKVVNKVRKACLRETGEPTNPTNLSLGQLDTDLGKLLDRDEEKKLLQDFRTFNDEYNKFVRPYTRESKKIQDKKDKRKRTSSGGIQKPVHITPNFARFLGVDEDHMMSRTDGTTEIVKYIKKHKLPDPKNGRVIHADKKMRELLNLPTHDDDGNEFVLTYFNLQKYMKQLYVVEDATTTTTAH